MMRTLRSLLAVLCFGVLVAIATTVSTAQNQNSTNVAELIPATSDISVGQKVKFAAFVKDAAGNKTNAPASAWFAAPFDLAGVDESGTVSFFSPGEVLVGAIVGGKTVLTTVMVKPGPVTRIDIEPVKAALVVGATTKLSAIARGSEGNPRSDVQMSWRVDSPGVAQVDLAGLLTALHSGITNVVASVGNVESSWIRVIVKESDLQGLSIEPRFWGAVTGDVVRFNVHATSGQADNNAVRWTVSGRPL